MKTKATTNAPARILPPALWWIDGYAGTRKGGQVRWVCPDEDECLWTQGAERAINRGKRLTTRQWPADAWLPYQWCDRPPDVIRWLSSFLLCSQRFRDWCTKHAPGAAQFLPVKLRARRGRARTMSYWGVNFLQTWRGYNDRSLEFDGRLVPDGATVGTSPSPQRVDPPEAICTDDFRLRCEREGFVGLCFEPVWLRTTPNTIVQLEGMKRDARGIVPAKCDPRSRYFSAKAFLKEFPDGAYKSYVPDMNPLSWCLLIGNDSLANVRALIKHNPAWLVQPDSVDPQNASVYQLRQFDLAYIKLFNRYGVSWNRQISTGITAFYKAVTHPRTPIASLRAMLAAGADATLLTLVGNTALHELLDDFFTIPPATILQRCKLLLAAGTRFDAINRFALTPIDLFDNITEQHDAHSSGRKQLRKALVALAAAQGVHVPTYEQRSDSNREPRSRAERKRREALFRRAMGW